MYVCIHETVRGFFEGGVWVGESATYFSRPSPHRLSTKRKVRHVWHGSLHSADSKDGPDNADILINGKG
jgi:hypothetical protein